MTGPAPHDPALRSGIVPGRVPLSYVPNLAGPAPVPPVPPADAKGHMKSRDLKLDDRDLRIIATLQREGRISKSELADRINLSSTPCWERLRRLEETGIIEGYGARISLAHFTPIAQVIVSVELESHRAEDFERFETAVNRIPEIFECLAVGGGIDYVLKILVRDIEAYQALVDGILQADIGVRRYYTYVVTKPVKAAPPPVTMFHPEAG